MLTQPKTPLLSTPWNSNISSWKEIRDRLQTPFILPDEVELHLIRHAETETNAKNLITGSQDVKLTANGEKQAIELGKKLDAEYDIAISSNLERSQKTIELAIESGQVQVKKLWIEDKRLDERSLGILEGQPFKWIPEYEAGDLNYAPDKGESYAEVSRRILCFLLDLAEWIGKNKATKVLISGHMGPMRIMVGILEQEEYASQVLAFSFPNAEVIKLRWRAIKIPGFLHAVI
ncbi:histidine phosphatase family protein [Phormidium sp. CCY1219]|uniref:histidine phosphatase family protein n=1 Tax=Phormidium sp. CCY1219 TaxID=2886104 RepID=UPI002D1F054F|nr:histidine phosphatase family protein [Phormidium sp. CCY1219]MEB3828301.1 histidine phosphatase family protein [Phormidium sp. CCY1219]